MNRVNHEDFSRKNEARSTNSPGIMKDYFKQISEVIEGTMTKKLSQEFSKTESRILGALSPLDEFLQNPQARAYSGPVPETSQNLSRRSQGANDYSSQNDTHPEVEVSLSQSTQVLSLIGDLSHSWVEIGESAICCVLSV